MHSLITPHPSRLSTSARRRLVLGVLLLLLPFAKAADDSPAPRLTGTFENIECEYSPGQEELARLLAIRFARHNQEYQAALSAKAHTQPQVVPPGPAEMRANRAVYLGRIAALLALKQPTALQEECYDTFLDNYERTLRYQALSREVAASLPVINQFTLWERKELVRAMESGAKVKGFTYDPATKSGHASFGSNRSAPGDRVSELAKQREKLHLQYQLNFETQNGVTTYRGSFSSKKKGKKAEVLAPVSSVREFSAAYPVIVPDDLSGKSAEEQATTLWDGRGDKSLSNTLKVVAGLADQIPTNDPRIAFIVLHETIELGIVDRYFRGSDRRWFCDGVANYGAWRVLRDLHGVDVANRIHDLGALLQKYAALRGQADLRKWPAAEHQSEEDRQTPLNDARYIFAEQAVALMEERGGKDVLPRLFAEIGKTKPQKVSIKTVEKAWLKLTGDKLDTVLAAAVAPLPSSSANSSANP